MCKCRRGRGRGASHPADCWTSHPKRKESQSQRDLHYVPASDGISPPTATAREKRGKSGAAAAVAVRLENRDGKARQVQVPQFV